MKDKAGLKLRGLATVSFFADDLSKAKKWYSELLGQAPYYSFPNEQEPAYIEFRIGDYQQELGFIDKKYSPKSENMAPGGAVIFWHVDDIDSAVDQLTDMGATVYEDKTEREGGFITASFVDPFGNILGVMQNPHYLEILKTISQNR